MRRTLTDKHMDAGNSDLTFILSVLLGLVVIGVIIDKGTPLALDYLSVGSDWVWGGIVTGAEALVARLDL